jgi:DNA modification methylase
MINQILHGDNIELMKQLEDNTIDAVVTDPPYGLSFMNKKWDYDVPKIEFWQAVYRVLKPGGHVLSFGGTRTYHRMVVNLEDAGFVIRDCVVYGFGSGFPKGVNIGKNLDKFIKTGNDSWNGTGDSSGGALGYSKLQHEQGYRPNDYSERHQTKYEITEEIAKKYEGWNTGLKPAVELICLARKPISENTIVENVLKWGTGGINIDGCRVGRDQIKTQGGVKFKGENIYGKYAECTETTHLGRYPSNFIHDGSDEVMELFPMTKSGGRKNDVNNNFSQKKALDNKYTFSSYCIKREKNPNNFTPDAGSAARYFYCAKPSPKERNLGLEGFENMFAKGEEIDKQIGGSYKFRLDGSLDGKIPEKRNTHPTVKPISLLKYLIRLITPPNGVVLDPFCGSGTTICAAILENKNYIGMELENDYYEIAKARENYFLNGGKL